MLTLSLREPHDKNDNKNINSSSTLIGFQKMQAKPNLYFEMLSFT